MIAATPIGMLTQNTPRQPTESTRAPPMTGPVADVSKSGLQGYQLWSSQLNAAGGLLGHQLKLDVLDDGFDPNQTATDYTRLISQDRVNLLLGTFSSLLNAPASAIAARSSGLIRVCPIIRSWNQLCWA